MVKNEVYGTYNLIETLLHVEKRLEAIEEKVFPKEEPKEEKKTNHKEKKHG